MKRLNQFILIFIFLSVGFSCFSQITFNNLYDSNTKIANNAQGILLEVTGKAIHHPIVKIPNGNNLRIVPENSSLTTSSSLLRLYPNPSTGIITVEYDELSTGNLSITVYNLLGERVVNSHVNNNTVNLSSLENGIYFVNFIDADHQLIDYQKLTIQN